MDGNGLRVLRRPRDEGILLMTSDRSMTARGELTRTVLAVLLIGALIAGSFWILRPFLLSAIWAAMIVVATWPLMLAIQRRLRRRVWAVIVMTGTMLLIFVVPLVLAIEALVGNMDTITGWFHSISSKNIPPPPAWVDAIPVV